MTPILNYLHSGELPVDHNKARKLGLRASWFVLIKEVLYKRGFAFPYLGCLTEDEANYALREIYEGICGDHSRAQPFTSEVLRTKYYWPTVQKDAFAFVQACDKCQWFANIIKVLVEELTPITSPWPLTQWRTDIAGPLPTGKKQMKFLLVTINYFTKLLKHNPWQKLQKIIYKCLFGRMLSAGSEYPRTPLVQWVGRSDNLHFTQNHQSLA